jgi:hypothetical protein
MVTVDVAVPPPSTSASAAEAEPGTGEPTASPLPARIAALERACRSLPPEEDGGYCADEDPRGSICAEVVAQYRPDAAHAAVACLSQVASPCDYCGARQCAKQALERAWSRRPAGSRPLIPECDAVRKSSADTLGSGDEYGDLCTRYAYGMNGQGRRRFARCLADSVGIGVRFCLWDPSATPCTEGGGSRGGPDGFGSFR